MGYNIHMEVKSHTIEITPYEFEMIGMAMEESVKEEIKSPVFDENFNDELNLLKMFVVYGYELYLDPIANKKQSSTTTTDIHKWLKHQREVIRKSRTTD